MPPVVRRALPYVVGHRPPTARVIWTAGGQRALSVAFCVAAPLGVGVAAGRADLGAAAALAGMTAAYGHQLPRRRRAQVVAGVGAVMVAAVGLGGSAGGSPWVLPVVLGLLAGAASAGTALLRTGPPGALGVVLVGGSASALGASPVAVGQHVAAAAVGAALAWAVVALPRLWDPPAAARTTGTAPPPATAGWLATAVRTTVGVTAAGAVAAALGLPSTYWASTAAVAVLLGTDARAHRTRAGHRVTGTLVGVGLAALLFAADLPVAAEVVVVALLLVGVELLVAHQYPAAVALITPLSLLLVHIGVPDRTGPALIGARLTETVVGIVLALAAGLLSLRRRG